jgi:hypothetical protein
MKELGERDPGSGGDRKRSRSTEGTVIPTLTELGVSKKQSSEWQGMAGMDTKTFEQRMDEGIAERKRMMAQQKEKYVSVDQLAQAFRISERAVQRLAIYEGMPRKSRGEYPYFECLSWFIAHLQKKVCRDCDEPIHAGPCRGSEAAARAKRLRSLEKITGLAPTLVGLDAEAIRTTLAHAVADCYNR